MPDTTQAQDSPSQHGERSRDKTQSETIVKAFRIRAQGSEPCHIRHNSPRPDPKAPARLAQERRAEKIDKVNQLLSLVPKLVRPVDYDLRPFEIFGRACLLIEGVASLSCALVVLVRPNGRLLRFAPFSLAPEKSAPTKHPHSCHLSQRPQTDPSTIALWRTSPIICDDHREGGSLQWHQFLGYSRISPNPSLTEIAIGQVGIPREYYP